MKRNLIPRLLALSVTLACSLLAHAVDHTVTIKNEQFSPTSLTITVGERVTFKNADTKAHTLYSVSKIAPFESKPLEPGKSEAHTFGKDGNAEIWCRDHAHMSLKIKVNPQLEVPPLRFGR